MLLKSDAVRLVPDSAEAHRFKAFRVIPKSALQQVLEEGIQPRPPMESDRYRVASSFPANQKLRRMPLRQRREEMQYPDAVWSFGRRRLSPTIARDLRYDYGYDSPMVSPLMAAARFPMGGRDKAIVASTITPPGKIVEDREFDRNQMQWITRPQFSYKPVRPEYLSEVIPVDYDDQSMLYLGGGDSADDDSYIDIDKFFS